MKRNSQYTIPIVLVMLAGLALPFLVWFEQVPFQARYMRDEAGAGDWLLLIGGALVWAALVCVASVMANVLAAEYYKSGGIYLVAAIAAVVCGVFTAFALNAFSPLALTIGFAVILFPAIYVVLPDYSPR
ncbi:MULTISPECIES: hypothetical protein [Actinomycetaceae]|uniref:hypothetical protein n=1 Tax=Actinomycetaceae TaxID=2049 RepID=UPI0027850840|nr:MULTISPECIES: hypothetical protein [Actinomycetaceae]MDP9835073.1 hypothetical protein [Gleimia europaea]MDU5568304.1 hypothetical protein [Actinomyces sp.]